MLDYQFQNTPATFNGATVAISGLFSFDSTPPSGIPSELFADIQLTGASPLAGHYSCGKLGAGFCNLPGLLPGPDQILGYGFSLNFADTLGTSADPLASLTIGGVTASTVSGLAVPVVGGGPLNYTFSADAATVLNGAHEAISGSLFMIR